MADIASLSAVELAQHYRRGALSPVEVAADALARAERFEPQVNAFVSRDPETTLAEARQAEERWQTGQARGPLDGVPVTIKDNIAVRGWTNHRGSAVTPRAPMAEDGPGGGAAARGRRGLLGKTTMPEYGWKGVGDFPLSGITRNPWDTGTGPGGSSAGAAVCAALNIGCIHLGTDGAGSIRIPAAFTGTVGIKSTYGRVPAYPVSTMGLLAHLGPLTRTVQDAAVALAVIGQPDARDMTAMASPPPDYRIGLEDGVRGLRIGWSPRLGYVERLDPEIEALTAAAAQTFAELGASVEEADPGFADPRETLMTLWSAGAALALRPFSAEERTRMDPGLIAVARQGEAQPAAAYVEALLFARNALAGVMAEFHARYDLLLTPTLPLPAFAAGHDTPPDGRYGDDWVTWTPYTYPFNITQQPAISVPAGLTSAGLPAGLQIVGPRGADDLVLRAARAFEAARPFPILAEPRPGPDNPRVSLVDLTRRGA